MLAWRLCRQRYLKLDGAGAAKFGGRWNPIGLPLVYMSESDALAVLEVRVHLPRFVPETYVFAIADIPDHLIEAVEDHASIPDEWSANPAWSKAIGSAFVHEGWAAVLSVPSSVVPASRNLLLNPAHPDFSQIEIQPPRAFRWDERLWDRILTGQ